MKKTAEFWNNKYEKKTVIYAGRTLKINNNQIEMDVKNFITANDALLQKVIELNGLKKATYNETAYACQKFVVDSLTYISDDANDRCSEFWQFPFETYASKLGDCEDGAILMASLMINAGIPAFRVKVCAGTVQPEPTAPLGGHAYCVYLADRKDGTMEWEVHDWCYYEDTDVMTGEKPLLNEGGYNNCYKEIWFSFNNEYSWSNVLSNMIKGRVKENEF